MRYLTFLILILLLSENSIYIDAKSHKHRKQGKGGSKASPPPVASKDHGSEGEVLDGNDTSSVTKSSTFSVLSYGAKGDGVADDTNAFEEAWADACKVQGSTVLIPSGSVFLVKLVAFSGPNCQSNIVFQLDGKIIAPTNSGAWGKGLLQWLDFSKLKGIAIRGQDDDSDLVINRMPSTKPTALRFYGSTDVTVTGITIQNSPQTHLKFDNCIGVQVFGISISSPGNSPNTDGIHLQNSQDVVIHTTNLAHKININKLIILIQFDTASTGVLPQKVVLKHQDVQRKKDAQGLLNNVIEETASKLVVSRKSKVKALVGAFETVISLQESKPSTQVVS
ncbi:polygalacturonase At1g48100-like [Salvia hispanica]|uniref:polygalacturonase At1g48100-like n=1 Tax=Salvia hispanica TaxID=49212 RepID=UPI002009889C|nr:polygalacturonase At1g48100-like [Salvia hispanica]